MFHYTICTEYDRDIFYRQCLALEKNIPGLKVLYDLEDVDGSQVKIYDLDGKSVRIDNSYLVGAVYIDSETELEHFFL